MFNKFYDALYSKLLTLLSVILTSQADPVKRLSAGLKEIGLALSLLRDKVLSMPFPSKEIEILFFKTIKPKFVAQKIFHFELYGLDMNKPVGTKDMLLAYYKNELQYVERFFSLHPAPYDYYRRGGTEMDYMYFIRGAEIPTVLVPEMPEVDPLYSTSMDYLFAKFMAYELLQQEILKRIGLLDGSLVPAIEAPATLPHLDMKWTGKIVNLGELIYGLYYTGQLNDGNAQLKEIVALFERMFNVKIRDVHHTFGEIKDRKLSSPTKFIDSMAARIQEHVENDLKYTPVKN